MISRTQYLPLVKQESFLRAKYEAEGLSVRQIAALTFSSRQTVVKYLEAFGIALRPDDRQAGTLPFGKNWRPTGTPRFPNGLHTSAIYGFRDGLIDRVCFAR
jgi:hypothetical protein